jgi:RNA-directed DNA polymerase
MKVKLDDALSLKKKIKYRMNTQDWLEEIKGANISKERKASLSDYVNNLSSRGVPIIWDLNHLSSLLGVQTQLLRSMIQSSNNFYRTFSIPKRRGGSRILAAPFPSLLMTQRWILNEILSNIVISNHSHGFVKDRSIITNAELHLNKKFLLKMDIQNYFPSISLQRVIAIFKIAGYEHSVAYSLAKLCTLNNSLPQGAATSPALSNIVAKRIDRRIAGLSKKWHLTYSRYADDLAFSGDYISSNFMKIIESIINDEGFSINTEKTKLVRNNGKKIVTGISVSGDKLRLPKKTRRILRQEIYFASNESNVENSNSMIMKDPVYIERLLGKLAFWKQIDPSNEYVLSSIKKIRKIQQNLDLLEY